MDRYQFDPSIRATMEASPIPFAVYQFIDRRVATLLVSQGFCDLFGFKDMDFARYLMDNDMYRAAHPDDKARIADAAVAFAEGRKEYDVVYRTKTLRNDDYLVVHARGGEAVMPTGERLLTVWYTGEGTYSPEAGVGDTLSGALNQMLREESMVRLASYDPLTGLPNLAYFFKLCEAGIRRIRSEGGQPALLYMDLCGMKAFNNKWGFAEGDKLIRAFAGLIANRFNNENCARIGQDHFAAFTGAEGLDEWLDNLFEAAARLNGGRTLPVRVGVCLVGEDDVEIGRVCDRAKMACDVDRRTHVSIRRWFDEGMLTDAERSQYIIDNLDRALAEGWIRVYYQPIVRAANGRVCDEEALSRWIDPVKGFLSPAEFIPALEDARLIYKLDLYVLDQVLQKLKHQADAGLYVVPQSLNLSRNDFDSCDIVEEIRRRVDASGIARDKLTIEITESVVGSDFEFMKAQVARFRELGFPVWMDDFGSGYSSLDVLQNIKFDLIKFDMRFMKQFDGGDEGKIILTELTKMALALGVETVCEGVERADQVEFLRQIGCTKIQGFYYCKPVSMEQILERYRQGIQIGFENPAESEYYTSIGRINLYDLTSVTSEDDESLGRYFDTLPTAILEVSDKRLKYVRCNEAYYGFMQRVFQTQVDLKRIIVAAEASRDGVVFVNAAMRCAHDGNRALIDEKASDGSIVHSIIRRVAVNPVTGTTAIAVAVLAVEEDRSDEGTTYEHIARALSADYINLYYVDLDTEEFIEYTPDAARNDLSTERRGKDFFNASRQDAQLFLCKEDVQLFTERFTKENVMQAIDEHGSFVINYRLLIGGRPAYVLMKAVRMRTAGNHIIVGVSNVDAQMRQKEALARIQAEQTTYARITALGGNYICIYTVDPQTCSYTEYSATTAYEGLGLAKQGEDFFGVAQRQSAHIVLREDQERFKTMFNREAVMQEIGRSGVFEIRYRMLIDEKPIHVSVKAALVQEQDGPQLIIGVDNIDAQVRREQEYERKLSDARSRVNLDGLTGVKNRTAYDTMAQALTRQIAEGQPVKYAIALCDIVGLERVNETLGRQEGDALIRRACGVVCETFKHSPVFRVAAHAFAVIAQGHDYEKIDALAESLEAVNREDTLPGGATIVCGMAKYGDGDSVASVFARADEMRRGKL